MSFRDDAKFVGLRRTVADVQLLASAPLQKQCYCGWGSFQDGLLGLIQNQDDLS